MEEQRTITLNYALTFADIREGLPMTQAKPVPLWRRLLGTFGWLFFLLMLLLWWFTSSLQPNLPIGSPQIEPRPGVDDVWLVLLPSLIPALLIGMGVVLTILRGALATDGTAPAVIAKRGSILGKIVLVLCMIATFVSVRLLMNPQWQWEWTPTRPKVVTVAVAPWVILCVLCIALAPLLRWSRVRTLWNTTPAFRMPNRVELNQDGIVTVNAKCSSRYRWSYFVRYSETKNLLRLYIEDQRIILIPKRAVGEDQMFELRSLICSNIAEGKFLVSDPRFAVLAPQPVIPVLEVEAQPSRPPLS